MPDEQDLRKIMLDGNKTERIIFGMTPDLKGLSNLCPRRGV